VFLSGPACLPRPAYIFEACIRLDGGQASIYRPALAKIRPAGPGRLGTLSKRFENKQISKIRYVYIPEQMLPIL